MYRKLFSLLVLISVLSVGLPAAIAAAQGQAFTESFDDPQLPGWEHSPEVIVSGGVLRIAPANFAARLGGWQNFNLSFKLRYSGEGETHINYRASDNGSYLLALRPDGVSLLRTTRQAEATELARAGVPLDASDWIDVRISLSGDQHTISVNGKSLLAASDPDPLPPGTILFASGGGRTTELDDVALQAIAGEPAAPPGPVEAAPTAAATPTSQATTWPAFIAPLLSSQGSTLEWDAFVINLVLAVITSFILSRVYIYWGGSLSNRRKFAANFMLVTVTTTFIILVVRSSVALSLGLVGALSIIRFRAAIKEPEELAYLFFAISLGIGLGDNQRLVTLIALLVVIALVGLAHLFRQSQADVNLHLSITSRGPDKVGVEQVMDVLKKHCAKLRLLRCDENPQTLELSFVVEFQHVSDLTQARAALQGLSPAIELSFLDNKGVW
ncbi:MAG: DUF4956 domain-containing protein [Thermoflexales bacterium]|nr:DUF4956 domain-containing protein [Thermoflexales bacterium]